MKTKYKFLLDKGINEEDLKYWQGFENLDINAKLALFNYLSIASQEEINEFNELLKKKIKAIKANDTDQFFQIVREESEQLDNIYIQYV